MANKLVSIVPSGTNNYLTPSLSLNRLATDLFTPGTVGLPVATSGVGPMTGSFGTSAQGTPNMTVAVNSGQAYVTATPTGGSAQLYAVTSDASENVTISANSTGGTRYDFLYLKLDADKLNNPSNTALDVATLTTQRSTTQYVDSNGALANALLLAEITVANGATSISNSNIADRRISVKTTHSDGWLPANETWTYASATTFTISGDVTSKYNVGDKIKLTQSGSTKYFYVTGTSYSSPNTTITITGGSDYTLANTAIYNNFFSKYASPNGFPGWFNWSPSFTGFSSNPTGGIYRFQIIGRQCTMSIYQPNTGTSNATTFTISLPITAATVSGHFWVTVSAQVKDNSSVQAPPGNAFIGSASTTINFEKQSGVAFTASGGKSAAVVAIYEI